MSASPLIGTNPGRPFPAVGGLLAAGLAGAVIGSACYFFGAWTLGVICPGAWAGRVLSSWINLGSLAAFGAALGQLLAHGARIRRENAGFGLSLLGDDDEALLLPEDVQQARKQLRELPENERSHLTIRLLTPGLQRARANWSAVDVAGAIKGQADLIQEHVAASYATVRYLAWAIPSIGFIGTVLGIGQAMGKIGSEFDEDSGQSALQAAAHDLHTAFDTTFVALVVSLVVVFLLYRTEADDDRLLVRATDWCMRRLPQRMHISKGG